MIIKRIKRRLLCILNSFRFRRELLIRHNKYRTKIKELRKKDKINVVFLVLYDSIWKCDDLYHNLLKDDRYNPIILICPIVNFGKENMLLQMEKSYKTFVQKGYSPILSYDKDTNIYLDVEDDLHADILFYTNPYDGLIDDRYNIRNVKSALTCYIPYFYNTSKEKMFYDLPFHRMLWKYFIETNEHLSFMKKTSKLWNFSNCYVTGYTVFDDFEKIVSKNKHKCIDNKKKRIIWAPHHTINDNELFKQSSFLLLNDVIIQLCQKYEDKIEIIFRPHPLLKLKLYNHKEWGKSRTDNYYSNWNLLENGSLSDGGDYIAEFYNSDGIIHDCGSFLCEYLYIGKPAIYVAMDEANHLPSLNTIALEAYNSHYIVYNAEQLEEQLLNVIINKNDFLTDKRKSFKNKFLKLSTQSTSDKIIQFFHQTF